MVDYTVYGMQGAGSLCPSSESDIHLRQRNITLKSSQQSFSRPSFRYHMHTSHHQSRTPLAMTARRRRGLT